MWGYINPITGQTVQDDPFKQAPVTPIPVPTPNPSGSPYPSTKQWDIVGGAYTDQPSWDVARTQPSTAEAPFPYIAPSPSQTQPTSSGGGGGGGGGSAGAIPADRYKGWDPAAAQADWEATGGPAMEQAAPEPQIDWNAIYAPAIAAYQNLMDVTQNQLPGMLQQITGETGEQVGGLQRELATRTGDYAGQRTKATGAAETFAGEQRGEAKSAIAEARRQAAELQQGIQARYGGTTGTGRFVSELLGQEAMRGIGKTRQGLQQVLAKSNIALRDTLGQIDRAVSQLQTNVAGQIADIESRATNLKQQARDTLNQRIAEIGTKVGEAETAKAQARMSEVLNYQDYVRQVNERNATFKQNLYVQARQGQLALTKLASQAKKTYQVSLPGGQQISPLNFQRIIGGISKAGYQVPAANLETLFPWARGMTTKGEEEELPDYLKEKNLR